MTMNDRSKRMPVVFFGHGSPTTILTENAYTKGWFKIANGIPRPEAILCVSAHWYTRGTHVTAMEQPRTIHDFGRLAAELFQMQYPAPGSPELARRVKDLVQNVDVNLDQSWGFDHGSWTVLSKAFPDADIPVVQLSIDGTKPAEWHLSLGAELRKLREEGVLIVGSGNIVHNLSVLQWKEGVPPYDWAVRFRDFIVGNIEKRNFDAICDYEALGKDAQLSVPHPDHFLPLLYVLGASDDDDSVEIHTDDYQFKSLSMASFAFS